MCPTWRLTAALFVYVAFEGGRMIYHTTMQQWSEEAILHVEKETMRLHEFADSFYSLVEQMTPETCFLQFMERYPDLKSFAVNREDIRVMVKDFAPSLCHFEKNLYFFNEKPEGIPDKQSPLNLVETIYRCGEHFASLLTRIDPKFVEQVYNYTIVKISMVDLLAPLLDTPELTPHVFCDLDFTPYDISVCHMQLVKLEELRHDLTEYLGRTWHLRSPLIALAVLLVLSSLFWSRRNAFTRVFHKRFEGLWGMLQQIDQVLQRRLENLVIIMQCAIEERLIGRLKIVSGIQSLLLSSHSPSVTRQFYRIMENCVFHLLEHLHLASEYIKLEMQSPSDSREMVNLRMLLDGCLQVYMKEIKAKGICLAYHYANVVPTSVAIEKLRLRTALLCVIHQAVVENNASEVEIRLASKKVSVTKNQTATPTHEAEKRADLKYFDIQITIKCKTEQTLTLDPAELLDSANLRVRNGRGIGLIYAKKALKEMNGDFRISTANTDYVVYDLSFQVMGRFHVKDFHPILGAVKTPVVLTMNVQHLKSNQQLIAAAELVGVKLIHASTVSELSEQMISNRCHRLLAVFFHDPTGTAARQLSAALPAVSRGIPLVELVGEGSLRLSENNEERPGLPGLEEGVAEVLIDLRPSGSIREARSIQPCRFVVSEEPLMFSDAVTAMAIGAFSLAGRTKLKGQSADFLRKLSYGRRSLWEVFADSLIKPGARSSVSCCFLVGELEQEDVNELVARAYFQYSGKRQCTERLYGGESSKKICQKVCSYYRMLPSQATVSGDSFKGSRDESGSTRSGARSGTISRGSIFNTFTGNSLQISNYSNSLTSILSQDTESIAEPITVRFSDPVAHKVFQKVSAVPVQMKHYAYFVVERINEVGFATNILDLYKKMVLDQRVQTLPDQKNMGFYELVKSREYMNTNGQTNECAELDASEDYIKEVFGAEIHPTDTPSLVKKVYEELDKDNDVNVLLDEEKAPEETNSDSESDKATPYVWSKVPEYTVPASVTQSVARMDTVLCLTPTPLTETRLNRFREYASVLALEFIFSWDFDISSLEANTAAKLAYELLLWCADKAQLTIPKENCLRLVLAVQLNYNRNPFHCFNHALHSMQAVILISKDLSFQHCFTYKDLFVLMLAALGHDIGHPGVTNEFLISMRSFTSILFNETGVLENYHIVLFLDLLKHPDLDILKNFSPDDVQRARKRTIEVILSTDKAQDTYLMETLQDLKNKNDQVPVPSSVLNSATRDACLMHAADHALALLNFPLYRKWAEKMLIEMHFQNTMDEALKLPKSYPGLCSSFAHLQRLSEASLAGSQVTLIESHYLPFFSLLAWYFPGDLEMRVSVMKANGAFWQHIRDEEMKKTVALNVNPEQEEWRNAKLHIISSKIAESRDRMRVKAAKLMRAEITDVYYEPFRMEPETIDSDEEDDAWSSPEDQIYKPSKSGTKDDSFQNPRDSYISSPRNNANGAGKEAMRERNSDFQCGNTPARKSALKKDDSDAQKATTSDHGSAGSTGSRKNSMRARFADDSLVDQTMEEEPALIDLETDRGNEGAGRAWENEASDMTRTQGDATHTDSFSEELGAQQSEHDFISGNPTAEEGQQTQSKESATPKARGSIGECLADYLVRGPEPRASALDPPAGQSSGAACVTPTGDPSHVSEQPESANSLGEFVYDEATGLVYDQQGYAYDALGNVTAYIDEAGILQPYTSPELPASAGDELVSTSTAERGNRESDPTSAALININSPLPLRPSGMSEISETENK